MPVPSPFPNRFRAAIRGEQRQIGCWSSLATPITSEILGQTGFDWILLDGEHTVADVDLLSRQLVALKGSVSAPVVRPPSNDPLIIKRLLDAGFFNFLIPFVGSAEEARQVVAATRYPPEGIRGGSAAHRSNGFGAIVDYFSHINQNITVMVQIETPEAADQAEAIAAVEGVDGVFVGPSDLAASMGHIGQAGHPDVQAVIARVFAATRAAGKGRGILAPLEADARRYLEMGATFIAVGVDTAMLRRSFEELHARFDERFDGHFGGTA